MKKARAFDHAQTICANAGQKQDGAATISNGAPPTVDVCARIAVEVDRFSVQVGGRISDSDLNWMAKHPSNRNCTDDCEEEQSSADCDKSLHDRPAILLGHLSPSQARIFRIPG